MSDCIGPINIIPDNNQVVLLDNNKSITVVDNNCCTDVNVTQPITSVVQILTGPIGAAGTNGLSAPFTYVGGNVWNTTSSIEITGSFTVSGSNTFRNIGPAQFTGSVDVLGNQSIFGNNGYILLTPTVSNPNLAIQEIHSNDDYPWTARFYNDTFSSTNSVMSYFGWSDGRFVFHNDSTQSIGLQVNGYGAENGLLVYQDRVTFVNNVEVTGSITAPSITGSLLGTASYSNTSSYAKNAATASNILGGKATHIPFFLTDTTLATSSIYQSGSTSIIINQDNNTSANPEALYVWQPSTSSFNVISGKGNLDNYLQLNIQNTNQGTVASSDVVATANNGGENDNYIDMGINSENFAGFLGGPNDSYLYTHGHNFHIGNINDGYKTFIFNSSSLQPIITLNSDNAEVTGSLFGTASWAENAVNANNATSASYALTASYASNVPATSSFAVSASYALTASYASNVPATASYAISASHALNADNANAATYASTAGNGGVTQIIAGSGVTLLPPTGLGAVTVITTGGGGTTVISGSNVTQSFSNLSTWTFNHDLGIRTPIIEVFDSNYNQIIPQNIQLTDTASATITFPTLESGFAIASIGGTTGTVVSSSYSLFSTYASTASYYVETDPIFTAKSGSFLTTASFNQFTSSYKQDSSSFSSSISALNNATSSYVLNSQTSSMSVATSSYVTTAQTASYVLQAVSASFASTSSYAPNYVLNSSTSSFATTGSNIFIGNQTITGSLNLTGSLNIIGNQTTIGDRILTGSWYVTGSSHLTGNTYLSGSISVSGSQTFNGNMGLTGSLTVSGSTTQIGNNTLTGNTVLSGSITISGSTTNTIIGNTQVYGAFDVSGSSNFRNSVFVVTGSQFFTGSSNIIGNQTITGSLNVIGDINVVSGSSFTRWGNKLFNYGAFSSTITQSGSADTILSMSFNSTDVGGSGVSLVNGTKITVENTGIYNLQFSSQFNRTNSGTDTITIWFAYTGSSVANSATDVVLTGGASVNATVASWNYVLPMSASSYVQIYWSTPDDHVRMTAVGTRTVPTRPAVPSVIATLTQIA